MSWLKTPVFTISYAQWANGALAEQLSTTVNMAGCGTGEHKVAMRARLWNLGSASQADKIVLNDRRMSTYQGSTLKYRSTKTGSRTLLVADGWSWIFSGAGTNLSADRLEGVIWINQISEWTSSDTELRWRLLWKETCT